MENLDLEKLKKIFLKDDRDYIQFLETYSQFRKYFKGMEKPDVWYFYSDVALNDIYKGIYKKNLSKTKFDEINQVYWSDVYQSLNAANCIFLKRASTLLESSLVSLKNNDFLSSAILARSLLEVCMWNVYHALIFKGSLKNINGNPKKCVIESPEMQAQITKLIFGTNERNVVEELKQHKVLKIFDQVAKGQKKTGNSDIDLEKIYDLLSEYVHPNVEGNSLFVNFDINGNRKPALPVKWKISKNQEKSKNAEPHKFILKTLIWSMDAMAFAHNSYSITCMSLFNKFKTKGKGAKKSKRPKLLH